MRELKYRVKLVVPCGDCHYFYEPSMDAALLTRSEILEDLASLGDDAHVYVYVETRHGHVRVL